MLLNFNIFSLPNNALVSIRWLNGMFNGSVGIVKSYVREITDQTNQGLRRDESLPYLRRKYMHCGPQFGFSHHHSLLLSSFFYHSFPSSSSVHFCLTLRLLTAIWNVSQSVLVPECWLCRGDDDWASRYLCALFLSCFIYLYIYLYLSISI